MKTKKYNKGLQLQQGCSTKSTLQSKTFLINSNFFLSFAENFTEKIGLKYAYQARFVSQDLTCAQITFENHCLIKYFTVHLKPKYLTLKSFYSRKKAALLIYKNELCSWRTFIPYSNDIYVKLI